METENPQANSPESPKTTGSADKPELNERVGIVEAILFVTGNAVEKSEICRAMNLTEEELEETLNALEGGYDYDRRGLRLCALAGTCSSRRGRITPNTSRSCSSRCRSNPSRRR